VLRSWIAPVAYPLITLVGLVAVWQAYVQLFTVPDYILPQPFEVLHAMVGAYASGSIWPHLAFTLQSFALGYVVGCGCGILLGGVLAESATFERFFYVYIILLQSMPKVALAPLIVVWFGFGIESKIVMVALICFFPVFINTLIGIKRADVGMIDVLRVLSASRLQVFLHVKIPAAASNIFAGLQIAVVLGLIGAVVAEFVASQLGLGTYIQTAALHLDTSEMLTGVFTLAAIGVAGNLLVRFLQTRIVFWENSATVRTNINLEAG
jgi:NitT/TauT family transport system permease protein